MRSVAPMSVTDLLERVEATLAALLTQRLAELPVPELRQPLGDFVLTGGKRVRARFCYWGWRGADEPGSEHAVVQVAAAVELFHAFGLIHDDILDGSALRRGRPSLHRQYARLHAEAGWRGDAAAFGLGVALLMGDTCLAWATELIEGSPLPPTRGRACRDIYRQMWAQVWRGALVELVAQARGSATVEQALDIARYKTAGYTVTAPLRLGATIAGAPTEVHEAYRGYGEALGEAFQLSDDLLGVFGDPARTGKSNLDDLRSGKPTALTAWALDHATLGDQATLRSLHGNPRLDEPGAEAIRTLLVRVGAADAVRTMIEDKLRSAVAALRDAPINPTTRQALEDLAIAVTRRDR